jgi:hypothetical protein
MLLAAYGAFYLASVVLTGWTLADWGTDVTGLPPPAFAGIFPRGFISLIFFVTSFPALIVGTTILCVYSIHKIDPEVPGDKEHVAVLLTIFGFAYLVVGAWPLMYRVDLPWEWQKQILGNGVIFAWMLYVLGSVVFSVGAASLYIHSRIYHRKHPELLLDKHNE